MAVIKPEAITGIADATLTHYWRSREQVEAYLRMVEKELDRQRQEQDRYPSPAIQRLRELAHQREQQRVMVGSAA